MMKTSVVILNWNGKSLMESLLPNVLEHTLSDLSQDVELVVADNGSTDGSLAFLETNYPDTIKRIDLAYNHGFAEGYNQALSQLDSKYAVLLNSDVEVTPGWLIFLTDYMDAHPDVAACQPKIRSLRQRECFEHAGASGGFMDFLGYPFCRGRVLSFVEEDRGQYDTPIDLFWATGACLCVRMDDFRNVGEFDARFFAHMEEIDLCWRLRSRGRRIVCLPQSVVYHLGGATLNKENPRKTYLNYRNNLLMLYKNCTPNEFAVVFIIRLILDYMSVLVFLLSWKWRDAKAVLRARWSFLKMKPHFTLQRLENLQQTKITSIPEIYRGSIILGYYLCGKRRFTDFFHT
ncbi:MAG: glycosyltransferase family 2 protein [Bacteroidales bacterium]|nr:glycosyltransferase family 2 protein [Bacteroidales bacterium]MDD3908153.1 glycosyltransferase family 2 protein [Bacteroidales bacterium]MDD4712210.1 glycosyltransferase family 2 protein [Bacteroidales bacterium]